MKKIILLIIILLRVNLSMTAQVCLWGGVTSSISTENTINEYNAVIQISKINIGFGYNKPINKLEQSYQNAPSILVGYEVLKHFIVYAEGTRLKTEKYKFGLIIEGRVNNAISFHTGLQEDKTVIFGFRLCAISSDWFKRK